LIRRILLLLAILAVLLPVGGPAHACLCASGDPRTALDHADAAFIGRLVFRGDDGRSGGMIEQRFTVDEVIKGELGREVVIRTEASSCGLAARLGWTVGLFLERNRDAWTSSSCSQIVPDVLRRIAQPLPAPNSVGPVALLVGGRFGDIRTIALDAEGGIVAYGKGRGYLAAFALCEGSRRVVEAVSGGGNATRWSTVELAVRDIATLELRRSMRVEELEAGVGGWFPESVSCRDPTGSDAYVAGRSDEGLKVLRVREGRVSVLYEGLGRAVTFSAKRAVAYLTVKKSIVELDMRNGRTRPIATLPLTPISLVLNPDESVLAGTNGSSPPKGRVFVVDLRTREVSVDQNSWGDPIWLDPSTFVVQLHDAGVVRAFNTSLESVPFRRQGLGDPVAAHGGRLFGASDGVVTVSDDSGVRVLRSFDNPDIHALAHVDDGPSRPSTSGLQTRALAIVLGLMALVVAIGLRQAATGRHRG
jgi:hypothetical protein